MKFYRVSYLLGWLWGIIATAWLFLNKDAAATKSFAVAVFWIAVAIYERPAGRPEEDPVPHKPDEQGAVHPCRAAQ